MNKVRYLDRNKKAAFWTSIIVGIVLTVLSIAVPLYLTRGGGTLVLRPEVVPPQSQGIPPVHLPSTFEPVTARCRLPKNLEACELVCTVSNRNNAEVAGTTIGFMSLLPVSTKLSAPPDLKASLEKPDTLPVPDPNGNLDRNVRAFTITVPLLPPKTDVPIELWTDDQNNKSACHQLAVIDEQRRAVVKEFFKAVRDAGVVPPGEIPDVEQLFKAVAKQESLFKPDMILSKHGRSKVGLIGADEQRLLDMQSKIYSLKPKFHSVFENAKQCMAPIFTVEGAQGANVTFALMPPDIRPYWVAGVRMPEGGLNGLTITLRPQPPTTYKPCE